ncbi:ABC transporter ATP-binding protein, partial [Pseudoalteromonas sp. S1609]
KPQSCTFLSAGEKLKELDNHVAIATDRIALTDFLTANKIINLSVSTVCGLRPNAMVRGFKFGEFLITRFDELSSGNQKKGQ